VEKEPRINLMPKKAYLANHYQSDELKRKYLKSQDPVDFPDAIFNDLSLKSDRLSNQLLNSSL
jgi:hypothetical protein